MFRAGQELYHSVLNPIVLWYMYMYVFYAHTIHACSQVWASVVKIAGGRYLSVHIATCILEPSLIKVQCICTCILGSLQYRRMGTALVSINLVRARQDAQ